MRRVQIIPKNEALLGEIMQAHGMNLAVNPHQVYLDGVAGIPGCWLHESRSGVCLIPLTEMATEINKGLWLPCEDNPAVWMPNEEYGKYPPKDEAIAQLRVTLGDSKADRLLKLFLDAHDTFVAKNGDYGDAFAYTLRKHGDKAPLIRITDKFLRIETLLTGREAAVKYETVNDTILDLGNYCFMWLMEREDTTCQ